MRVRARRLRLFHPGRPFCGFRHADRLDRLPRSPAPAWACGLLVLAGGLTPLSAWSQLALNGVSITGTRVPQAPGSMPADVVVIDSETIQRSTADSVEDLLRREAGVQLSRNGGPGQSAGIFLRGMSASSTVVLIDGVRVGSATLGQAEFESLALPQIDRIEVLRGPASSLYGADAVGGVVQIFTRRGEGEPRITAHVAVGGYASRQADAGVSGSVGAFDYALGAGHERSDGVSALRPGDAFGNYNPDRDGYERNNAQVNVGYTPAEGHRIGARLIDSRLDAQYDGSQFLPPDFAQDATPDFRNHLKSQVIALDYSGRFGPDWTTSLQIAHDDDDLRSGGSTLDRFRTTRDQATWQAAWRFAADQQLLVAYEHLGDRARTSDFDDRRSNNALVVGYSGRFGAQTVLADLRHDSNSVYGNNTTGRLGWSLMALPSLKLRALAGTTFRAPTYNDLYFPGYGVPTIEPERGHSVEVGAEWRHEATELTATVYRNRVRNLIGYEPDPDGTLCPPDHFGCAANTGRARLQGATLGATQRWGAFGLRAAVDFLDAKDADTGVRLERRADKQATLTGVYTGGAWDVAATLFAIGARPDGGTQLGGYATVDLSAHWRFAPQWRLEAKLLNAADRSVEPARDYQGLGRQAWLGLRYDGRGL